MRELLNKNNYFIKNVPPDLTKFWIDLRYIAQILFRTQLNIYDRIFFRK